MTITLREQPSSIAWRVSFHFSFVFEPKNVLSVDEKEDTGKPVIRLFGVNANGNSVCAHVHNFTAYFYIHIIEKDVTITAEDIENFRLSLNR